VLQLQFSRQFQQDSGGLLPHGFFAKSLNLCMQWQAIHLIDADFEAVTAP
jgi:hypothetical protein